VPSEGLGGSFINKLVQVMGSFPSARGKWLEGVRKRNRKEKEGNLGGGCSEFTGGSKSWKVNQGR